MKISKGVLIAGAVTLVAILLANIIATEYRIKREKREAEKNGPEKVCPACPACPTIKE